MLKKWLALPLSSLALIVGCASDPDTGQTLPVSRGQEAVAQIDTNLKRLNDLQVFRAGALIERIPEANRQCYNLPCNDEDRRVAAEARVASAERLSDLTARVAEVVRATGSSLESAQCEPAAIDANLERLSGLGIIEVEGLVEVEARSQPQCYNLPCEEDRIVARQANCDNAVTLAKIVEATEDMR